MNHAVKNTARQPDMNTIDTKRGTELTETRPSYSTTRLRRTFFAVPSRPQHPHEDRYSSKCTFGVWRLTQNSVVGRSHL